MILSSAKEPIQASADVIWKLLLDKIRNPQKYVPGVQTVTVVQEFGPDLIEREMFVKDGTGEKTVREIITADPATMTVMFKLKDDPVYTGYVLNMVFDEDGVVQLEYTVHWTPKDPENVPAGPDMAAAIKRAVAHTKELAERAA